MARFLSIFAGLRIAGLSGIYNPKEFNFGHYERPPFSGYGDVVSAYHVRNLDHFRLRQLRPKDDDKSGNPIDIMITHDWPGGIADYGDVEHLFRIKKFLKDDIQSGKLGNPAAGKLLHELRPKYWLAAHLHVAYAALVPHKASGDAPRPQPTKFLSLDKPIPQRQFLQVLDVAVAEDAEKRLSYDEQWLAILRTTDAFTSAERKSVYLPNPGDKEEENGTRKDFRPTAEDLAELRAQIGAEAENLHIKTDTFRQTAPPLKLVTEQAKMVPSSAYYRNPQTAEFCQWLGIGDLNKMLIELDPGNVGTAFYLSEGDAETSQVAADFGDDDFVVDDFSANVAEDAEAEAEEPEAKKSRKDSPV
ncbi:unnamed protein product [Caenorhabditis angaria]|uniref:Lariat debranching enzyme C-terminal domain-containing protein n=1 Tax=Caenorhabditis angaria TaxID=860376 RepID=A0A9P1I7B2_9PELO|nr:unnamed protein product [Caenorhabditis angaria]